ncbi:hypothetical protein LY78DRAFT_654021 [Colletotrichum sublineola]|nr:hypothetical protein LY78DRAFT_654021 [Colletotrichum sublineola]
MDPARYHRLTEPVNVASSGVLACSCICRCPASPSRRLQRSRCASLQLELASKHNISLTLFEGPSRIQIRLQVVVAPRPPGRTVDERLTDGRAHP